MKTQSFKQIMECTRISFYEIAWAGNAMGLIKRNSLLLAAKLNPEITVGINSNHQIGIFSIRFGKKQLHLPLAYSADFDALHESKF
jgi:hypothetical protein